MMFAVLGGLLIALSVFFLIFCIGNYYLKKYFNSSSYLYNASTQNIEELQHYVTLHNISATDTHALRKWARKQNIDYFTISRRRMLLYDNTYTGTIPLKNTASQQLHYSWQYFHKVEFADGNADVYIYKQSDLKFYVILDCAAVAISAIIWLIVFVIGVRREVIYIKKLNEEVKMIENGCLSQYFTINGNDELSELATGLEHMRIALLEKEENEFQMKTAQEKLVLGMAHDLRTPLTSLLAYIEIIKKLCKENNLVLYANKAIDKALQIRNLSEQLFEFFLVNTEHQVELEAPCNIQISLGDYLSELCVLLENNHFIVSTSGISWKECKVQISSDYMGRIINNILSNILKYADQQQAVELFSLYEDTIIAIKIMNGVQQTEKAVSGTGIGLKNIFAMMKAMHGTCETIVQNNSFAIILYFPIYNA